MLNLENIKASYPANERRFNRNILREYLQYKILETIFNSPYQNKLTFMGDTALRIVYGNTRFSEDLDFDNQGLTEDEFVNLSEIIKQQLLNQGYQVEIRNVFKGAFHAYIKVSAVLFDTGISSLKTEKLVIRIDTFPQSFSYQRKEKILNKFDVFTQIFVVPLDLLLSQKIYAVLNRARAKGRDFFDISFILPQTGPNYEYLEQKANLQKKGMKESLLSSLSHTDFQQLAKDVEPFLINPEEKKRITLFKKYLSSAEWL
jgi:predicted nucleotidyltransferase component of viral defense system